MNRLRLAVCTALVSTACSEPAAAPAQGANERAQAAVVASRTPADPALARAIAASAPFEVPGRPCLARPRTWPELTPAMRRRQREIQSDSHWLNAEVRRRYPDRLAYTGLDASGGRYRHIVALTGNAPVPAMKLSGRAAGVPVVIVYNAPWSLAEVGRRRDKGNAAARALVPELQGEGFHESPEGGFITLDAYTPDGQPDLAVLAKCDALRFAYRLPVLITFNSGRVSVG